MTFRTTCQNITETFIRTEILPVIVAHQIKFQNKINFQDQIKCRNHDIIFDLP